MRPDLKMYVVVATAALALAFAGLATAFAATNQIKVHSDTTNTTSTSTSTTSTTTKKVFRSQYCKAKVDKYNPRTWGCTTITVDPFVLSAGDTTTVTYLFKAKIKLKFVLNCLGGFYNVTGLRCLYSHKSRVLRRGRVVKRTLSLKAPTDGSYGEQDLDNFSRFYKKGQKWEQLKMFYWLANASACVTTASQPDACSTGK